MIHKTIRQFHITTKYKGYALIVDAIAFYLDNDDEYIKITKDVYPMLSHKYELPIYSVERSIRTVVKACWKNDANRVECILGYHTNKCPTNTEFIDSIAFYLKRNNKIR